MAGQERPATTEEIIRALARQAGVPPDLAVEVARRESNLTHDPTKVGPAGEIGIFQLTPPATKQMAVADPRDLIQNIKGGIGYLKRSIDLYDGDVRTALMAYNGGEGNVSRGTVSDAAREYADSIIGNLGKLAKAKSSAATPAVPAVPAAATAGVGTPEARTPGLIERFFSPVPAVQSAARTLASAIDQRETPVPAPDTSGEGFIDRTGRTMLESLGMSDRAGSRAARIQAAIASIPVGLVSSAASLPGAIAEVFKTATTPPSQGGSPLRAQGPDPAAETFKGLVAGGVEAAGDVTPADVAGMFAGRGARGATKAAQSPELAQRLRDITFMGIEGTDSAGQTGRLVKSGFPAPVSGHAPPARPLHPVESSAMEAALEALREVPAPGTSERATFINGGRGSGNFLPPGDELPAPKLQSRFAPGAAPGNPPGNVTFVEDSVEQALRTAAESRKAKAAEAAAAAAAAEKSPGAVKADAESAVTLDVLVKAAARNRAALEAGTGVPPTRRVPLETQQRLSAAAGQRPGVPTIDPEMPPTPAGTVATSKGLVAAEGPAAAAAVSINPSINAAASTPPPVSPTAVTPRGLPSAVQLELLRKSQEAALAGPPAAASGLTNAQRAAGATPQPPRAAVPAPVKAEVPPAVAPPPVAAAAVPALPAKAETVAAVVPEPPAPVQQLPMGATGGGPIGKPRTEPTQTRTRNAPDIVPGKTVKEAAVEQKAAETPRVATAQTEKELYEGLKNGTVRSGVVSVEPAKAPTRYKKYVENGYAVEKHPDWGSGNRTFLAGKTQADLNATKAELQKAGKWPGGEAAPAVEVPPPPKAVVKAQKKLENAAPGKAVPVVRETRAAQAEEAAKAKTPEEAAAAISTSVPPEVKAVPKEDIIAALDDGEDLAAGLSSGIKQDMAVAAAERKGLGAYARAAYPEDAGAVAGAKQVAEARKAKADRLRAERKDGPPPKGVEPQDWKAINEVARTARRQLAEGIEDVRLIHAMQNFWGAEETARRLGKKGKDGANWVRNLTGQKGKLPGVAEMAKAHDLRMKSLARDPEGFIRTEALIAGFGFAAGGLVGATLGGEDIEDRFATAVLGALGGGMAGRAAVKGAKAVGTRGLPKSLKEAPESLATLDTANLLTGPAIVKATLGSFGGVAAGIMQRLGEGRLSDVRRGVAHVGTTAPKTYLKTLMKTSAELEEEAAKYSAHGRGNPTTAVGKLGQRVLVNGPLRLMSAADAAGVSVLRQMGFSSDESARLMLVGEPTSWRGQAIVKAVNTNFILRMLVKFPRVGVNIVERSIEYTPGLNRIANMRSTKTDAVRRGGFVGFKEQGKLSPRTLNAMGAVGAASFGGGYLWGKYSDPSPYQVALFTTVAGPASGLAAAGAAMGKAQGKGKAGVSEAVQTIAASVPKIDEQTVRFLSPAKRFDPGGPIKRLIEQASGASVPGNPYGRR